MRKMIVALDWRFGPLTAGTPGLPMAHTFVPKSKIITTGARWCGDHGMVMEVCKVIFVHAFCMRENNSQWVVTPSGVVWDDSMAVTGSDEEVYSVTYTTTLAIGPGHDIDPIDPVRDRLTLAEATFATTATSVTNTKNMRTYRPEESGLVWDLTDSAGNGTLVAAADMELEGSCRTKSSETTRDGWPKRLQPPFGRCDVQIGVTQEYTTHPITDCHILYKMKRVTMQEWYQLVNDQIDKQS